MVARPYHGQKNRNCRLQVAIATTWQLGYQWNNGSTAAGESLPFTTTFNNAIQLSAQHFMWKAGNGQRRYVDARRITKHQAHYGDITSFSPDLIKKSTRLVYHQNIKIWFALKWLNEVSPVAMCEYCFTSPAARALKSLLPTHFTSSKPRKLLVDDSRLIC